MTVWDDFVKPRLYTKSIVQKEPSNFLQMEHLFRTQCTSLALKWQMNVDNLNVNWKWERLRGRIVLLSPSSDFIYSTSFTLSPGLLADLMLCLICIASHVLSSCEFGSKSSHLLCYRNLYFSWCVSRIICGVHLQRPLFLNHATGSCIRSPVTPINPVVGFKLVVIFGLICDRCNRWVSVQLPNVISTGFCEWDGERRIFSMEREIETDGLTLERREDVMTDVSTMEYKEAKPRHAARRKIELNSNHTACNARGPQDQKSQWEVLPFSTGMSFPFFLLMSLSLIPASSSWEEELNVKAQ